MTLTNRRTTQVVLIDSQSDGVDQISDYLSRHTGIESIHIVSHGTDGEVRLGNTVLNANTLDAYAGQIAAWSSSLTSSADILFYGCDLAATEDGQLVIEALSELTGADINASDDLTGHADLGGDWDLEYVVGHIETDVVFSVQVQHDWVWTLATVEVDILADVVDATDGKTSLREAIIAVNDGDGGDTIELSLSGIYKLSITSGSGDEAGDLDINKDVTITGLDDGSSVIDASELIDPDTLTGDRVFNVLNGDATFRNLTITGGDSTGTGGGISVSRDRTAILDNVEVTGNRSATNGGGIYSVGTLTVTNSTIKDNFASNLGGGISVNDGEFTANNVTVSNNTANTNDGGGIYLSNGIHTLTNVTVSGNDSGDEGGGVYVAQLTTGNLNNVTITNNTAGTAGGGITNKFSQGTINVTGSIIAGNRLADSQTDDVSGTINAAPDNIIADETGLSLGALADNGGSVQTHALLAGSVAIDAADSATSPATDARGFTRDDNPDIGAFEATLIRDAVTVTTLFDIVDGDTSSIENLIADMGADGSISLREAIIAANADAAADTILLESGFHQVRLNGDGNNLGDFDILTDITIQGAGAGESIISGVMSDRLFQVATGGDLTLQGLTLERGRSVTGGAVRVEAGGSLQATDTVFQDNSATTSGGAIYSEGDLTLNRASLVNNSADQRGGAINVFDGTADLTNVTVSGNTAGNSGGGIIVTGGSLTVNHSTIANNDANAVSGGGVRLSGGSIIISNSIFSGNSDGSAGSNDDISGPVTSNGNNIIQSATPVDGLVATDTQGVDPGLSDLSLDTNSGQFVHVLSTSSIALDAADGSAASVDQRGVARGDNPDIGSFQLSVTPPPSETPSPTQFSFLLSTQDDVAAGNGGPGLDSFSEQEIVNVGGQNFELEPTAGTTNGTFESLVDFDDFANPIGDIDALHRVNITQTVDGVDLEQGDILFSTLSSATYRSDGDPITSVATNIYLFRPTTPGDYSSGTFTLYAPSTNLS